MLGVNELRKIAARSGARDIGNVEIDVVLTYLLQLFAEKGVTEHVAFKGGTFLRKMVFGPRGRLSTDLDFTRRTDIDLDDLMLMMLDALGSSYQGLSFRFDKDKDWYLTDEGCAANPVCFHDDNPKGVKIKLQVSTRETPVMPVTAMAQIEQNYFGFLEFKPAAIPSLTFEEAIAEKIRAASQRATRLPIVSNVKERLATALETPACTAVTKPRFWSKVRLVTTPLPAVSERRLSSNYCNCMLITPPIWLRP